MKNRDPKSPVEKNVEDIARLERAEVRTRPLTARISLAITNRVGSFAFAAIHIALLLAWWVWNAFGPEPLRFDPFPFGLLTMIVSMEGVVVAIFVLITQNRMSAQSDERDHLNLQVDLLAEQEMTMVLRMLKRIEEKLGIEPEAEGEREARQLMQETNIYELIEQMRRRFDGP